MIALFVLFIIASFSSFAQSKTLVHAHNDYLQQAPFYLAYSQKVFSIEADIFLTPDGELLVGHTKDELKSDATLEHLYILPIVTLFKKNNGKMWKGSDQKLQLMLDLKTVTEPTLTQVISLLQKYPKVFDGRQNPNAVWVVITGNMPLPDEFVKYPPNIFFDGRLGITYSKEQLSKLALISMPFNKYANWIGRDSLTSSKLERVQAAIDEAHALGKLIRFWGAPDGPNAWHTFQTMGVDIINTDLIEDCVKFFNKRKANSKHQ